MNFSVNQNMKKKVDQVGKKLAWSLLPSYCLLCRQPGLAEIDLCLACWHELPSNRLSCPRCALPLSTPATACADCLRNVPPYFKTVAPMQYLTPISTLIPRFKFHQDLAAGRLLAEIFCRHIVNSELPDALVPVPLHNSRLRQRGFDQALELAKIMAQCKKLMLRSDLVRRTRNTSAQSHLDANQRRKNCRNAFVVNAKTVPEHIALVDDVMTTGATVEECTRALLKAGAKRVDVWVLARVAVPG